MPPPRTSPLSRAYGWNEKAARYVDLSSGRFVPRAAVVRELDAVISLSQSRIDGLSASLLEGGISVPEWQTAMEREVKLINTASGAAARGGWAQMSKSDWGFVGAEVKRQYKYLDKFAAELASGQMPLNGRVTVRAGMYAQSGRGCYEEMRRRMMKVRGVLMERRRLTAGESCVDCIEYAGRGWQPIGTLPRIGQSQCRTHCKCYFDYR